MNNDILISRIAPVSDADAAAMVSEPAARELAEQIMRTDPRRRTGTPRSRRRYGRMVLPAAAAAAAAAAAVAVALAGTVPAVQPRHTSDQGPAGSPPTVHLAAVTSPIALAANASVIANRSTDSGPTQWIYLKVMSTISHAPPGGIMAQIPGTRQTTQTWTRVDRRKTAILRNGEVVVNSTSIVASPVGWPHISYRYLNSLPTSPARLMDVIKHNVQAIPPVEPGATGQHIFYAVVALIENNPVLPARLSAALYGVLARLKSVHLGHATDLAGRKVLSLYQIQDGYLKEEIFINPVTYAYAGQRTVAVRAHVSGGLDGTIHVRNGELLADEAIVTSTIVNRPGEK